MIDAVLPIGTHTAQQKPLHILASFEAHNQQKFYSFSEVKLNG